MVYIVCVCFFSTDAPNKQPSERQTEFPFFHLRDICSRQWIAKWENLAGANGNLHGR